MRQKSKLLSGLWQVAKGRKPKHHKIKKKKKPQYSAYEKARFWYLLMKPKKKNIYD